MSILVTNPFTPFFLTHWEYHLTFSRTENTASHPPLVSLKSQPPAAFKFPQGQQVKINIPLPIYLRHKNQYIDVSFLNNEISPKPYISDTKINTSMSLSSTMIYLQNHISQTQKSIHRCLFPQQWYISKTIYLRHKNHYMCLSPTISISPSP